LEKRSLRKARRGKSPVWIFGPGVVAWVVVVVRLRAGGTFTDHNLPQTEWFLT